MVTSDCWHALAEVRERVPENQSGRRPSTKHNTDAQSVADDHAASGMVLHTKDIRCIPPRRTVPGRYGIARPGGWSTVPASQKLLLNEDEDDERWQLICQRLY